MQRDTADLGKGSRSSIRWRSGPGLRRAEVLPQRRTEVHQNATSWDGKGSGTCFDSSGEALTPRPSNWNRATLRLAKGNTKLTPSLPFGMEERAGERRRVSMRLCDK